MTAVTEINEQAEQAMPSTRPLEPSTPIENQRTVVTVRMITDPKEVGSIIGKKGDNVKRYRETSGAKINISDASCAERIVTLTGALEHIGIAFKLMCIKFEDDLRSNTSPGSTLPPVNVRLVIPASQCGSLIGKAGMKIKDLRVTTGAQVQVGTDMLPHSTERVVTVTGSSTAISNCVTEICSIMLESPPKGATIPYRPKPTLQSPMMYGMTAAYGLPGQTPGLPTHPANMAQQPSALPINPHLAGYSGVSYAPTFNSDAVKGAAGHQTSPAASAAEMGIPGQSQISMPSMPGMVQGAPLILPNQLAGNPYAYVQQGQLQQMNAVNNYLAVMGGRPLNNNMLGMNLQQQQQQQQQANSQHSSEMVIPNELIGCIIGRGGAKINEIRQLSGAQVKISNCEEGTNDRKVTITGYSDNIAMATYLINTSVEIHKAQLLMSNAVAAQSANVDATNVTYATSSASTATIPSSISSTSVTPSVSQSQLTNAVMTQLYQSKQLSSTSLPHNTALPSMYGIQANPYALGAAYDPKALLSAATANKLKMMSSPTGVRRFAPY